MGWVSLLSGLLKLASAIARHIERKQLLGAGQAQAIARINADVLEQTKKALAARKHVSSDARSLHSDPNRRD